MLLFILFGIPGLLAFFIIRSINKGNRKKLAEMRNIELRTLKYGNPEAYKAEMEKELEKDRRENLRVTVLGSIILLFILYAFVYGFVSQCTMHS